MERRITQLRGDHSTEGVFVDSIRKHNTDTALSVKSPQVPSKRTFAPKRAFPIKPSASPVIGKEQAEERHVTYHEFLKLDQAGPAVICSENTKDCAIVAVKRSKVNVKNNNLKVPNICHNVVDLIEVFDRDGGLYMVYEQMDVSLRLINSIPKLRWNEHEIAAVCREVSGARMTDFSIA